MGLRTGVIAGVAVGVAGSMAGIGYGLHAAGLLLAAALTLLAVSRPTIALPATLCLRFATDLFGNDSTASTATAAATLLTTWVCAVILLSRPRTVGRLPASVLLPFVAFLLWVTYCGIDSPAADSEVLREVGQWGTYLAIFLAAVVTFPTPAGVREVARVITITATLQVGLGLGQLATEDVLRLGAYERVAGTFPHPGWLAFYLAVAFVALPAAQWPRGWRTALGGTFLVGLVLTYSRGALVFLLVWAMAYALSGRRPRAAFTATSVALVLALIPDVRGRFLSEIGDDGRLTGSYQSRSLLRKYAIELWRLRPWDGHGTAAFFSHFSPMAFGGQQIEVHSDVFKLLADQGIVGLGLYLAVILTVLRHIKRGSGLPGRAALVALVVTLPVMGLLDVYYRMNTGQAFLWLLLGAAFGAARRPLEEPKIPVDQSEPSLAART